MHELKKAVFKAEMTDELRSGERGKAAQNALLELYAK